MIRRIRFALAMCCVLMFTQISFAQEKIGIVDIQSIVSNSSEVRALKQEHNSQVQALNKIVTDAQTAIAKETDPQKIVMLQDKFAGEFNSKKQVIDSQYQSKLSAIESRLKREIYESAKKYDYDLVIAKSVVFYGGEDITSLVAKDIK